MSDAISPILTNPLGSYGLSTSGMYGSYADPTMSLMGNNAYYGAYGNNGYMNGLGMMGYMNPEYIKQMYNTQFEIEKNQFTNANQMHELIQQAEVHHLSAHDRAIFQKALVDGDIQNHIRNLADVIREGNQNAIVSEYTKLKQNITTKYAKDILDSKNTSDVNSSIDNIISLLYGQILSTQNGGVAVDLRSDIKKYGESAFAHGFNKTFLGKKDYHDKYTEETLSYIYGTPIDNKQGKERMEKVGGLSARVTESLLSIPTGAAVGAGIGVMASFFAKILTLGHSPFAKGAWHLGRWGASLGMAGALIGDVFWQTTR